jgi:hypothetical protein
MPRTARSRSALPETIAALLPPSSSSERPNRSATRGPTSRCAQQGHARVLHQRLTDLRTAEQHLRESLGGVVLGDRPREHRVAGQGGERGQLGGLPDDRVAADQGDGGVPRPHRGREVEGGDHADHAEGVPGLHQPVTGALRGHGAAVQLARQPDREVADVDHLLDLTAGLGGDLPGLDTHQDREVVLVLGQQLAEPLHQRPARRRRHPAPDAERLVGAADRLVDVRRVPPAQRRDLLPVDRRAGGHITPQRVHVDAAATGGVEGQGGQLGLGRDARHAPFLHDTPGRSGREFRPVESGLNPQTMLSSGRRPRSAKRSTASAVTSTGGVRPSTRSRSTSPIAGPIRKPCPENPVA